MGSGRLTSYTKICLEWSERNDSSPETIMAGSGKKAWWHGFCGHEWQASIKNRVDGAGCPICAGNKVLKGFNDFATRCPEQTKEWSDKNLPLKPDMITAKSNKQIWWVCKKGHEWKSRASDRANGHGCPYCAGKILKGYNDLLTTNRKLIAEWSDKNVISPDEVTAKSRKVVWWTCGTCKQDWQASIVAKVKGMQCPHCRKKCSQEQYETFLEERQYQRSKKYRLPPKAFRYYLRRSGLKCNEDDECKIGLPLQFYFPELKTAVEFSQERANSKKRQITDEVKNDLCRKNGITIIRVIAPDCTIYDSCLCINRLDESEEGITEALLAVFEVMKCPVDIDVKRDLDKILTMKTRRVSKCKTEKESEN